MSKSRIETRPLAQHLFATNTPPVFQGGMGRGVQCRGSREFERAGGGDRRRAPDRVRAL